MINLEIPNIPKSEPYQEATLGNLLKDTLNLDTDAIRKAWDEADKGVDASGKDIKNPRNHVLGAIDDNIKKGSTALDNIDKKVNSRIYDSRSIIARARNSVCQFPIYVPQTIRVNEAHIIAALFERVYATFVQAVLAQNPIMTEEEANNLVFLKKFHTNIKEAADVFVNKYYEPIDEIDRMMCESIFYEQQLTENCRVRFSVVPTTDDYLIKENARLINEPLTGLSYLKEAPTMQTDSTETSKYTGSILSEAELREMAIDRANLTSEEKYLIDKREQDIINEVRARYDDSQQDIMRTAIRVRLDAKRRAEIKVTDELASLKNDIKSGTDERYRGKIVYSGGQYRRTNVEKTTQIKKSGMKEGEYIKTIDAPRLLKDSDIKKENGILPYTIEATFMIKTDSGINREVRYIIGIKSVMHLFRTQDLAEDLRELIMGKVKGLQKVRYKTGEIKFKDYFLNLKGLKSDASKHINYNKRWINTLKRLADYRDMNGSMMKKEIGALTGGEPPIPNGTLVLSQPDVITLANETGIDLSIISNAKRLAKSLFLIAIVIVDSSAGTMRILFPDMDNEWDVQSLASIDAALAKTDNSQLMKELNRMVNK